MLRKELFALRHTLSFHERCGCTANAGNAAPQQQQQQPQHQQAVPPTSAPLQVQQQPRPEWRQQQQQPQQAPHSATYQQQQQQQPPTSVAGQYQQHMSQAPVIVQTHASPQSHPSQLQGGHPPPPVHIQTQPQPMTARAPPQLNAGPTLAPSALQGINLQVTQPSSQDQHMSSLSSSQRAPPKLNLSPSSLKPQSGLASLGPGPQQQAPSQHQLGTSSDINRPGSAGARFGLATPNFADLFNGAMGKLGNGGTTPAFGAGLLFTPGGIMSSGGMLGGNSASNAGYNMSPDLPNTFGLSMQDIPIRPASAPPTPSPALDNRLLAPSQDYFSSKNMSSNIGTSAAFADFLAAYNPANLHSNNTGSVLA